ncbi:hypothetical protein [Acidocella sp.]|uniref:hypothetical protein n=1 Tax=Acidocella sp. TaxID=50710 RepID=UPI002636E20F|nr:hypothetical protein [Acidocella sp.]MDD2794663.1 hypothetical protein [Acidocella sp.]
MTIVSRLAVLALGLCFVAGTAKAQQSQLPELSSEAKNVQTTFAPVNQSLTDLIKGGATVLSGSEGGSGPSVILHAGAQYFFCLIHPVNTPANILTATSECYRLN